MVQAYSNEQLFDIGRNNYHTLLFHCVKLNSEGYWNEPEKIMKQSLGETLDIYVQSFLVMYTINSGSDKAANYRYIMKITDRNSLSLSEEGISDDNIKIAKRILAAPPVIIQLFGLRDNKKNTKVAKAFVDTLINILIAMAYLNQQNGNEVTDYIKKYYESISAFFADGVHDLESVNEKFLFRRICNVNFKTGYMESEISAASDAKAKSNSQNNNTKSAQEDSSDTKEKAKYEAINTEVNMESEMESNPKAILNVTEHETDNAKEIKQAENKNTDNVQTITKEDKKANNAKIITKEEKADNTQIITKEDKKEDKKADKKADNAQITKKEDCKENKTKPSDKAKAESTKADNAIIQKDKQQRTQEEERLLREEAQRAAKQARLEMEEVREKKKAAVVNGLMQQLNELVGLEEVKKEMQSLVNLIKVRKMRSNLDMPTMDMSYHMVFTGNPGTGKTTVARLVAEIYKELGVLSKGTFIETDRSGLVAPYIGQTALKVQEVVENAKGGVLFIDEAYALAEGDANNDFGKEAIDTLVKLMEDNRNDLVIIVAGYKEEMDNFLKANTGLISRFNKFIDFKDYTDKELIDILNKMAEKYSIIIDKKALTKIRRKLRSMDENTRRDFGNARGVRNMFETIITNQANRIVTIENPTKEQICTVLAEDV